MTTSAHPCVPLFSPPCVVFPSVVPRVLDDCAFVFSYFVHSLLLSR